MAVTISEHRIKTNGVELHVLEAGEGPAVLLAHGFPELSYSWRHQIEPLVDAGYRVIVPDQRGYGKSSQPDAIEDYNIIELTNDLLGVLDELGEERAVFVGHDWGSMVVWQQALLNPSRVTGVVGMSVPFLPRGPMPPVAMMRQVFADNFFYIVYFQEPGVAEADLESDVATTMRRMLCGASLSRDAAESASMGALMSTNDGRGFVERLAEPASLPDWLAQAELDHYVSEFSRTGFRGGINWYRNFDRNWEMTPQLDGAKVTMPSLFIGGALDPVLVMTNPSIMDGHLADHRGTVIIEGAGHWVQQQSPDEVNAALVEFLAGL